MVKEVYFNKIIKDDYKSKCECKDCNCKDNECKKNKETKDGK